MLQDALIRALAAALTLGVWAVLVALAWSRPREPRNRRVAHRDVKPANAIPRNTRATASESGVREVTPRNLRRADRSGQGGTKGAA